MHFVPVSSHLQTYAGGSLHSWSATMWLDGTMDSDVGPGLALKGEAIYGGCSSSIPRDDLLSAPVASDSPDATGA